MKTNFFGAANLIKKYKHSSVFFRNLKKFTFILTVPFMIFSLIIAMYYNQSADNSNSSLLSEQLIYHKSVLQSAIYETNSIFSSIAAESFTDVFLSVPDLFSSAESQLPPSFEGYINRIRSRILTSSSIKEILICSYTSNYVISSYSGGYSNKFSDSKWFKYENDKPVYLVPGDDKSSFYICYAAYGNRLNSGVVVFKMSFSEMEISDNYSVYIINDKREPVYSQNPRSSYSPSFDLSENEQRINIYRGYADGELEFGGNYIYTVNNSPIKKISLGLLLLLCLSISFVTALILSFIFSVSSYRSIETIIEAFGDAPANAIGSENEISYISDNILSLSNKAKFFEYSFASKMNELKNMQLSMLQLQFTPHFLFNTLNTFSMLKSEEDGIENPSSKIITLLSDLLTAALDTSQYIVSLETELDYSKKYLEIEKIKTNYSFDTFFETEDPELYGCKTVKFILQPILENAIKYGIKEFRGKKRGMIKVSVSREANNIIIRMFNNGQEIDKNRLMIINELLNSDSAPDKHRGMYNVNKRIKLVFGNEYGCTVKSDDSGTVVTIKIPCEKL